MRFRVISVAFRESPPAVPSGGGPGTADPRPIWIGATGHVLSHYQRGRTVGAIVDIKLFNRIRALGRNSIVWTVAYKRPLVGAVDTLEEEILRAKRSER